MAHHGKTYTTAQACTCCGCGRTPPTCRACYAGSRHTATRRRHVHVMQMQCMCLIYAHAMCMVTRRRHCYAYCGEHHITMTHCGAARGGGGARARVCADAPAARGRIPGSLTTAVRRALSRAAHGGAAPCRQARTTGVTLRGGGAAVVCAAQWRQGAGPGCQMLPSYHS